MIFFLVTPGSSSSQITPACDSADFLNRKESCGAHFREEFQTPDGEAMRNDEEFAYVAAWEYAGKGQPHILHKEELKFEAVEMKVRSYK
ncbi:MAG: hypothetical protein R6W83_04465 [Cryobacterium sp.]